MIIIYKLWNDAHTKDFLNRDFQETIAKSNVIILSKVTFRLTGKKKILIMKCILL